MKGEGPICLTKNIGIASLTPAVTVRAPSRRISGNEVSIGTLGLNYYIRGNNLKL